MLREGTIVESPFWAEPVELKKVVEKSIGFHLIGSTINSGQHIDVIIPHEDLERIRIKDFTLSVNYIKKCNKTQLNATSQKIMQQKIAQIQLADEAIPNCIPQI